ncbi:hypothetical protein Ddc_07458 [Ditylenchus destructor]|nr:hypothetical protein Ddc_07458 [Ditylenchus destructor]
MRIIDKANNNEKGTIQQTPSPCSVISQHESYADEAFEEDINPRFMPNDQIVVGEKYKCNVIAFDEHKEPFQFAVLLKSRVSDYEKVRRLLRQYDEILHYDNEPGPISLEKDDYVLARVTPSELRRCRIVKKYFGNNNGPLLFHTDKESILKMACIDTAKEYTMECSADNVFFTIRPPFTRHAPFAMICIFGAASRINDPQKKEMLSKKFNNFVKYQTEIQIEVLSIHSDCFAPTVYEVKVTVGDGDRSYITYPDYYLNSHITAADQSNSAEKEEAANWSRYWKYWR